MQSLHLGIPAYVATRSALHGRGPPRHSVVVRRIIRVDVSVSKLPRGAADPSVSLSDAETIPDGVAPAKLRLQAVLDRRVGD